MIPESELDFSNRLFNFHKFIEIEKKCMNKMTIIKVLDIF